MTTESTPIDISVDDLPLKSEYNDNHLTIDLSLVDYRGNVRIAYGGIEAIQLNTSMNTITEFLDPVVEKSQIGDGENEIIGVVVATAEGDVVDITIKEEFLMLK